VALALLLLLTAMAIWRRNEPHLLVGWSWFLGTLVPMIGIVQVGEQATADRFAYIPTIGLFLLLVWLMAETVGAKHIRQAWVSIPACCWVLDFLLTASSRIDRTVRPCGITRCVSPIAIIWLTPT